MGRGPRIIVATLIAVVIAAILLKYTKAKPEVYMPPSSLLANATEHVHGVVVGTQVKTYGEHLFEGSADFYFINYKFQPKRLNDISYANNQTHGQAVQSAAPWFTGQVRVDPMLMQIPGSTPKAGDVVGVVYDPADPRINGVPKSMGVWSTTTGFWNHYLWCYVGFAAVVFLIQEIIRVATKTNDFRP
jgi:hypothetical protein